MSEAQTDWDAVSQVICSQYRETVIKALHERPQTPSEIDHDQMPHISRALQYLREAGLVELLVPEDRKKGRIYGLTERGREVAEAVEAR